MVVVFNHCISDRSIDEPCIDISNLKNVAETDTLVTMRFAMTNLFNDTYARRKFAYKDDKSLQSFLRTFGECCLPKDTFMILMGSYYDGAFAIGWINRQFIALESFEHYPFTTIYNECDYADYDEEDRTQLQKELKIARLYLAEVIDPILSRKFLSTEIVPWLLRHGFRIDFEMK
jgi:hypothetical protein